MAAGLLDGPVVLAAALLAAGGPAAEPGQAVIRTNVGNLVLNLLQEASEVRGFSCPRPFQTVSLSTGVGHPCPGARHGSQCGYRCPHS